MTPGTLATIIYTSGTTGRPKGCELTHGNFLAEVFSAIEFLPELFEEEDGATLLFLPLAHVFGRMIQVGASCWPGCAPGTATSRGSPRTCRRSGPPSSSRCPGCSSGSTTPRSARPPPVARSASSRWRRTRPSPTARPWRRAARACCCARRRALFDRLVYGKVKEAFGGQLRWAVSGGAPLGARLGHFFRGVGVTVLEGYGLTETTAATTVNTRAGTRIGTVGRPLPGFEVRIADDGVIQVRGGHVFSGYWRNPVATAAALDADGWFDTGDLGSFEDGYLTITGRAKEILVTSSGKNVVAGTAGGRAPRARPGQPGRRGR